MERRVANQTVRYQSRSVIRKGETEGGGPQADCWGAMGAEAGALGAFLWTTSTNEPGTQAAGREVLGLVAEGTGGGPSLAEVAAGTTEAVCKGGGGGPEGTGVTAAGAAAGAE